MAQDPDIKEQHGHSPTAAVFSMPSLRACDRDVSCILLGNENEFDADYLAKKIDGEGRGAWLG